MSIQHFDNEDDFDEEFERIEEINMEYEGLKIAVAETRDELEEAEKDLANFYEDNKDVIIMP